MKNNSTSCSINEQMGIAKLFRFRVCFFLYMQKFCESIRFLYMRKKIYYLRFLSPKI